MEVEKLIKILDKDFYTGVPDSQLKALCNYLTNNADPKNHIIAANEGNAVALGAGYHLATGKIPVIYMQNSGQGNTINPVASLTNDKVYAIPQIFIIGWRGEPNVKDEPQHIYQGEVTLKLLEVMDIAYFVITPETNEDELKETMVSFNKILEKGKSVAFVVKKGALKYENKVVYKNNYQMKREEIIEHIAKITKEDLIISTTGKASRELYEIRDKYSQSHKYDFLTVGSMGHSSSIALGVALNTTNKVWCIDGDGALLMHMGSMGLIGTNKPDNLVHILINNGSHETVGGMKTVCDNMNWEQIAISCGYEYAKSVDNFEDLDKALIECKENKILSFLEIKCAIGAREDLGRPKIPAIENKKNFMEYIKAWKNEN